MHGLYGQGKSWGKVSFSFRSGKVNVVKVPSAILVKGVVTIVLKIAAVSCQWLYIDPIGQGGNNNNNNSDSK